MNEKKYDSAVDTMKHKVIVSQLIGGMSNRLIERRFSHDDSKLESPEKECYDKFIPKLREAKYGSPEYNKIKDEMGSGLQHHYEVNRHHPEHFSNGVNGMTLIDVVEMFCDWYAASQNSDTSFEEGLKMNFKKYHIDPQLQDIMLNTFRELS